MCPEWRQHKAKAEACVKVSVGGAAVGGVEGGDEGGRGGAQRALLGKSV